MRKICEKESHIAKVITSNFGEAIPLFTEFNPHLLICDFRLTESLTSTQILNKILGIGAVHVIFITAYYDNSAIDEINQIKPFGYLTKPFREDQVIALIRSVNHFVINRAENVSKLRISERELEILVFLSRGFASKDISKALGISSNTVDTHRRNLLKKLGAHNSIELIDLSRELLLI